MSSKYQALKAAISSDAAGGPPPRWADILRDLAAVTYGKPTREAEQLMLAALQFGGELRAKFDDVSELPHGMTPEETVRSLAAQTLGEWRGIDCRPTLRRVASTVTSASLVSVIEAVIEKVSSGKARRWQAEPVAELHPQDPSQAVEADCRWDGRDEVMRYGRGDGVIRKSLVVVYDFGMSAVVAPRRAAQMA